MGSERAREAAAARAHLAHAVQAPHLDDEPAAEAARPAPAIEGVDGAEEDALDALEDEAGDTGGMTADHLFDWQRLKTERRASASKQSSSRRQLRAPGGAVPPRSPSSCQKHP